MVEEIRNLRTDIDNIDTNVITNTIDEYTKLKNPLIKNHDTFIVYDKGWDLNDENDKISKKCTGVESVHILFNLMKALEYKDITGIQVSFDYYNCKINSVAIGDGTIWNYCNKETTDLVTSSKEYEPQSELEYNTGKHIEYMLSDNGSEVNAGMSTFLWNYSKYELKRLLYTTGARLEINLEPTSDNIPVEINNLRFKVYFESSLQKEIDVIYNRLEVMNLPELIKQQSPVQYIYFQSKDLLDDSTLELIRNHCNDKFNTSEYESDDFIPDNYTENNVEYSFSSDKLFVSPDIRVVYVLSRTKQNDLYGKFGVPQIFSVYGSGENSIYYQFAYMTKPDATAPSTPPHSDDDNLPSGGWTAYPGVISESIRYCFVTSRINKNGSWGDWSAPVLFSVYSLDGEAGVAGEKGEDGLSTITLYRKANSLPDTPPLTGTIELTYPDSYVNTITWDITQGIDEIDNIKRQLINEHSQYTNINDVNNIFGAYSEWQETYDVLGDKRYVYMTKLVLNKDNVGSWSSPTVVAEIKNDSEDSSDLYGAADDSMVYTGKNGFKIYLYRYGSLVYYDIPSFQYTVKAYDTVMSDALKESEFEGFGISSFGSCSNLQNISNVSNGAMIRITDNKFHLRVNTDAYNTSSNSKKVNFTSHGVYQIKGTVDPDLCVEKDTETSGRLGLLKYFCFTAVFDGTDESRAGKNLYFKAQNTRRYYKKIMRHDIAKTFVDDNGEEFTTHYYARIAIRLNEGSYTFGVGFLGDKTYKEVFATRNITVYKSDLVIEQRIVPEGVRYDFMIDDEPASTPNVTTVICTDSFMNNQISVPTGGYGENYILTECTYDSTIYFPTTNTITMYTEGGIVGGGSTTSTTVPVSIDCTPISDYVKSITFKKIKADNTVESSTTGTIHTYELASNLSLTGYKTDDIKVKR